MELTHASFFSGVGGLDLGLERAGWRTVSFSEIDPYASAVLAERWPGVPNLGDITRIQGASEQLRSPARTDIDLIGIGWNERQQRAFHRVQRATLWSGGFPCQDLSVAGKRAGFAGERSSLAFAFLDLVERHRPPAILLENVPGLLSSNRGRDFGTLLDRLGQLGYWWAYRILDAQFFGVPQRRRRVFICALHAGAGFRADSAAAVLSVGTRCDGHSAAGDEAGEGTARSIIGSLDTALGHHGGGWPAQSVASGHVIADGQHGSSPDPGGVRAPDGLAGGLDDRSVAHFRKAARVSTPDSPETWQPDDYANTVNGWDQGDIRTTELIIGAEPQDDPLLPLGLDSHRYRCCGNGVVSNVSEWVGLRLAEVIQ